VIPRRKKALEVERASLLQQVENWLETPMAGLGVVWLALTVVDLAAGLNPLLSAAANVIWALFGADFLRRLLIAPRKGAFLRTHLLTLASLALPAARMVRFARFLAVGRVFRGLRLFRLVASLNRGMRSISAVMGRRGLPYVLAVTVMVTIGGAAGMYAFEHGATGSGGFVDFAGSLWWTAMLMTTMGSEYWPKTAEGRLLCLFLALYAFAVFGYVTAALASLFVARDAADKRGEVAGAGEIRALSAEIKSLRAELHRLGGSE
jgi:voltage-gated potassium channel